MKKRVSVFLALALMLAVLFPAVACADLERGSSGEEVLSLQTMLFDMGYLFEEADGKFGAKTEAAVKEYQKAAGLEETGMVSDELMEKIYQDWIDYWDWVQAQLRLDAGQAEAGADYLRLWEGDVCSENAARIKATGKQFWIMAATGPRIEDVGMTDPGRLAYFRSMGADAVLINNMSDNR